MPRRVIGTYQPHLLDTNLQDLSTYQPHCYSQVLEAVHSSSLYIESSDGRIQLIDQNERVYDSSAFHEERERVRRQIESLTPQPSSRLFLILGLDVGFTLQHLLPVISHSPLAAFLVIEPDERMAACAFVCQDLTPFIRSNRIIFMVGKDFATRFERLFDEKNLFAAKQVQVIVSSTANQPHYKPHWQSLQVQIPALRATLQRRFQQEIEETEAYYARKAQSSVTRLFALHQTEGMAVRYIQQRFLDECRRLGLAVIEYCPGFANEIGILRSLYKYKPDCLFFMNRSPGEYVDLQVLNSIRIPRMLWCVDDPNIFFKDPFDPLDVVFTWDQAYTPDLMRRGAKRVGHFPYVADLDRAQPRVRDRLISNVSYIGQVKVFDPDEYGFDPPTAELVRSVGAAKSRQPQRSYASLIIEHQQRFGLCIIEQEIDPVPRFIRYGMYTVANGLRRIEILNAVMPFGLKLYGGKDWLRLLENHPLKSCYQGVADPERVVPDIFVSSKINLNIHSLQALTSLNQRDFNCPLAGGFLLTDWVEGADQFFIPGSEMVFYQDVEDLTEKIDYYLSHERERQEIIGKGKERVLREHTYASRVPRVLETLNQWISEI